MVDLWVTNMFNPFLQKHGLNLNKLHTLFTEACIVFLFPQFPADLVTFTEEILNGKLHFLCSDIFDALRNFVPFVPFKKHEKRPSRSVTFSLPWRNVTFSLLKGALFHGCFPRFFELHKRYQIKQTVSYWDFIFERKLFCKNLTVAVYTVSEILLW